MFSRDWFLNLEKVLRTRALDSDLNSFDEILSNLENPKTLSSDDFAYNCFYVILASGFSQKTAKLKHTEIVKYVQKSGNLIKKEELLNIFNNQNKINAIIKIWENRAVFSGDFYALGDSENRVLYLGKLPHIGKITANHLARNLGINLVKYDIWIQRLGCAFSDNNLTDKIDNGNLNPDIKSACDEMFLHLEKQTGLPRGYIDVVLFRAAQNGLI